MIEDFFIQAAPIAGVHPKPAAKGGHVYRVGKVPRALVPIGQRLEPRFGRLGIDYPKVAFDKTLLPSDPTLEWVTPGHPLFEVVREDVVDRVAEHLRRGAIFYNLQNREPSRLDAFAASIKDRRGDCLHRRLFVVETEMSGAMSVRQPTVFLDGLVLGVRPNLKLFWECGRPGRPGCIAFRCGPRCVVVSVCLSLNRTRFRDSGTVRGLRPRIKLFLGVVASRRWALVRLSFARRWLDDQRVRPGAGDGVSRVSCGAFGFAESRS